MHDMVDMWAFRGLIEGGAVIDARGSFADWKFWCPWDDINATPVNPYALSAETGNTEPLNGIWHYVIPEKQRDPQSKTENAWNAITLKAAIAAGRAVALTVGQIVMLGGDDFELPSDMEADVDRWKNPQNVMKVYWEARAWLEGKQKAAAGGAKVDWWNGYQQRYAVIYLVFELMMSNPDVLASTDTVDEMDRTGDAKTGFTVTVFNRMLSLAKKVDGMIDVLKYSSGASRYTEMHFLNQVLESASQGKGGTLGWIQSRMPWLQHLSPRDDLSKAGFTEEELVWF